MTLASKVLEAIALRDEIAALACVDEHAGLALGLYEEDTTPDLPEALIHATARVPNAHDLWVLGVARRGTSSSFEEWLTALVALMGERI